MSLFSKTENNERISQREVIRLNLTRHATLAMVGWLCVAVLLPHAVYAQRVGFPDLFSSQPNNTIPAPSAALGNFQVQPAQFQPVQQTLPQLQIPQLNGGAANFAPVLQDNPANLPNVTFPGFPRAGMQSPVFPDPRNQPLQGFNIQPGAPIQPQGGFGPVQGRWPYEGTGSNWLPPADWTWPQQAWQTFRNQFLPRVLERPRARQTWIVGDSDNQLNINELELATTATIPNFLGSNQPLRVSPGFVWHWLDGPDSNVDPGFDLPARVYSAYLSFDHMTNPANNFGLENNFTIGVYSDFDNTSSDALRLTGRLVAWSRINSYTVGKLGVEYFDRVDVKLLPAFGIYMAPNQDIRWDLFFPRTKLAHRLPNLGDFEVWGYVGAEYGGGSWAIDRSNGTPDQADINDVRSYFGIEWMGPRRVTGFMEFGYVFDREIVYRSNPSGGLELEDAFIWRSGLAF